MSETIMCSQNDCTAEAVVQFNHLGHEKMAQCEPHWKHYKMIFCETMGVPEPITETVNDVIKLTDEDAELYYKATHGGLE